MERISETAFSNVSCCQRCLMISYCNWDILLVMYRSSQFIRDDGMSFSGNFWMMENNKSSSLPLRFWKNSFDLLRSLISMSIMINSLKYLFVYLGKSACFINSIGQSGEKDNGCNGDWKYCKENQVILFTVKRRWFCTEIIGYQHCFCKGNENGLFFYIYVHPWKFWRNSLLQQVIMEVVKKWNTDMHDVPRMNLSKT